MPSGLSFARFDAFGIYTRRTARGRHDIMDWCTRTAISALASGVSATSPSIPAVLRPPVGLVPPGGCSTGLVLRSVRYTGRRHLGHGRDDPPAALPHVRRRSECPS